jgi:hypothetical protein
MDLLPVACFCLSLPTAWSFLPLDALLVSVSAEGEGEAAADPGIRGVELLRPRRIRVRRRRLAGHPVLRVRHARRRHGHCSAGFAQAAQKGEWRSSSNFHLTSKIRRLSRVNCFVNLAQKFVFGAFSPISAW